MSTPTIPQLVSVDPLGHNTKRVWPADPGADGGRKARRPGRYELFIPYEISQRDFRLDGEAVAAVTEATRALQHLEASPPRVATLGALAQNLLRSESVASSRIEGVHLSHKRLARAAYQTDKGQRDRRAPEVLGNVEAVKRASEIGTAGSPLTVADVEDIHRTLLRLTEDADIARGVLRAAQNWIGGNDYNPVGASYVPPPPEHVRPLLADLCAFVNRVELAPSSRPGSHTPNSRRSILSLTGRSRRPSAHLHGATPAWRDPRLHPSDQPHPRGTTTELHRRAEGLPGG